MNNTADDFYELIKPPIRENYLGMFQPLLEDAFAVKLSKALDEKVSAGLAGNKYLIELFQLERENWLGRLFHKKQLRKHYSAYRGLRMASSQMDELASALDAHQQRAGIGLEEHILGYKSFGNLIDSCIREMKIGLGADTLRYCKRKFSGKINPEIAERLPYQLRIYLYAAIASGKCPDLLLRKALKRIIKKNYKELDIVAYYKESFVITKDVGGRETEELLDVSNVYEFFKARNKRTDTWLKKVLPAIREVRGDYNKLEKGLEEFKRT
jgi:hypothetical protein